MDRSCGPRCRCYYISYGGSYYRSILLQFLLQILLQLHPTTAPTTDPTTDPNYRSYYRSWAATEARCHGKGLDSNGGKVSRTRLGQQQRQGATEMPSAATEARRHGKAPGVLLNGCSRRTWHRNSWLRSSVSAMYGSSSSGLPRFRHQGPTRETEARCHGKGLERKRGGSLRRLLKEAP